MTRAFAALIWPLILAPVIAYSYPNQAAQSELQLICQGAVAMLNEPPCVEVQDLRQLLSERQQTIDEIRVFLSVLVGVILTMLILIGAYALYRRRPDPLAMRYRQEVGHLAQVIFGERPPAVDFESGIVWLQKKREALRNVKQVFSSPEAGKEASFLSVIDILKTVCRPFQMLSQHWSASGSGVIQATDQMEKTLRLLRRCASPNDKSPAQTLATLVCRLRTVRHAKLDQSVEQREKKFARMRTALQASQRELSVANTALEDMLKLTGQPNHKQHSVHKIHEIISQQTPSQMVLQIVVRSGLNALREGIALCRNPNSEALSRVLYLDTIVKFLDMLLLTEPLAWSHENLKKQYIEERGLKRNHLHLLFRAEIILGVYFNRQESISEVRTAIGDICTAFRFFLRAEGWAFEQINLLLQAGSSNHICHEADPTIIESEFIRESVKAVARHHSNFIVDVKRFGWKKQGRLIRPSEVVLFNPSDWL